MIKGDNTIQKFLRGMIIGILMMTGCTAIAALFVSLIKLFFDFVHAHHLDPLLAGGIAYILIGSIIYGVVEVNKKG